MTALDVLIGYAFGVGYFAVFGALRYHLAENYYTRRVSARALFVAPIWPIAVIVIITRRIATMWRHTGWGK